LLRVIKIEVMMALRKRKGKWMVDICYKHPNGRKERIRRIAPGKTKPEAEAYERQLLMELMNPTPKKKPVPKLKDFSSEFLEDYANNQNKPSEIISKEGILNRYLISTFGKLKLDQIGIREIAKFKTDLRNRGLSPKTIKNALAVLSKLLHYAQECEIIEKVPKIQMPKIPESAFDFLTFEEAERLLKAAGYQPDWHAMIYTAMKTGLRFGELSELRWNDVDLKAGRILVRRSFTYGSVTSPKNGKSREVPLSPKTIALLRAHRHLKSKLVFCKKDGDRWLIRWADKWLKDLCEQAGLRQIGWHALRHTFASHLAMRGRSIKEIQELLGHSDIRMTMRYSHLAPSVKMEAVATLDEPVDLSKSETQGTYKAQA
jgi:integrase